MRRLRYLFVAITFLVNFAFFTITAHAQSHNLEDFPNLEEALKIYNLGANGRTDPINEQIREHCYRIAYNVAGSERSDDPGQVFFDRIQYCDFVAFNRPLRPPEDFERRGENGAPPEWIEETCAQEDQFEFWMCFLFGERPY